MAGKNKKFRLSNWIRHWECKIHNWKNGRRIAKLAKREGWHNGTRQILKGGVWEDAEHNIYNCLGKKIGKVEWFKWEEA